MKKSRFSGVRRRRLKTLLAGALLDVSSLREVDPAHVKTIRANEEERQFPPTPERF